MSEGHSTKHILQSLLVNVAIAVAKGIAAAFTGSGAMLAETLHSGADCGNQLLLLLGVSQAKRPPDDRHPLGYGRALYFWSFMVALLLFTGGGVFSIYEGIHKISHPEPLEKVWLGLMILAFSLTLEGGSTISNIREIGRRRGSRPFFRYLQDSKDSDLIVIFGENLAASIGLILALVSLGLSYETGDTRWDGAGSLAIGVVLVAVALFLAIEIKSLLIGEAADPEIIAAARQIADNHPHLEEVLRLIAVQQGPGEVMVSLKVRCTRELTTDQLATSINEFEAELRRQRPEVRWIFVEPDLDD